MCAVLREQVAHAAAVRCCDRLPMGAKPRLEAGASKSPVAEKLKTQSGQKIALVHLPSEKLIEFPLDVIAHSGLAGTAEVVIAFYRDRTTLLSELPALKRCIGESGTLWVGYPKGTSGLATDLNRDIIRETLLPRGLRPNFQIAIDGVWSALRFVRT